MSQKDKHSYGELFQSVAEDAYKNNVPLFTTLEVTLGCNFNCQHCYNFDRNKSIPEDLKNKALSKTEILDIIPQLSKAGCLYLNLSGGEVLLHPNINEFVELAAKEHMFVRLKTNASLVEREHFAELFALGVSAADVSLYGSSSESYEKFTGQASHFKNTINGIKILKEFDIEITVNIILHRYNVHELKEMINLCKEIGVNYQISDEVTERYDGSQGAKNFEMTKDQFELLLQGEFGELFFAENKENSLQCSCAKSVCGISSTGEVYPCIGAPIPSGNLREKSFEEIWNTSPQLNKIRKIGKADFVECSSCEHIDYCSRSSGSVYINTGDYLGCDTHTYSLAESRHKHKDKFLK